MNDWRTTRSQRQISRTWRALIKKAWGVDPLLCPKCGGQMRLISPIEDDQTVEKILRHLDLMGRPSPVNRSRPASAARTRVHPGTVLRRHPLRPGNLRRVERTKPQTTASNRRWQTHAHHRPFGLTPDRVPSNLRPRRAECAQRRVLQASRTFQAVNGGSRLPT